MTFSQTLFLFLEEPSHSDQIHHQHGHIGRVHKGGELCVTVTINTARTSCSRKYIIWKLSRLCAESVGRVLVCKERGKEFDSLPDHQSQVKLIVLSNMPLSLH